MTMKRIIDGAYLLGMGNANAILLDDGAELTLVDAGFPAKADVVWDAVKQLGRKRADIRHLVFTHGHPDHIGSAAAIVRETGATTYMHGLDAPYAESGGPFRPMTPSPQLLLGLAYRFVWKPDEKMEPFAIDHYMADGDTLPVAGGLKVVGTPGHCAGQSRLSVEGRGATDRRRRWNQHPRYWRSGRVRERSGRTAQSEEDCPVAVRIGGIWSWQPNPFGCLDALEKEVG